MADEKNGGRFYGAIDKLLLAGILGFTGYGTKSESRVADELEKIRLTLTVAVAKTEVHDGLIKSNRELLQDHSRALGRHDGRISDLELLCSAIRPLRRK